MVYFEPTDDARYTAWVYGPEAQGCIVAGSIALLAVMPMILPRLRRRTRIVILSLVLGAGLVSAGAGLHESQARRNLGPALSRDIAAVTVLGAVPAEPVQASTSPGFAGVTLDEPGRSRRWTVSPRTAEAACAAIVATAAQGWQQVGSNGACVYTRQMGRVALMMRLDADGAGAWAVLVEASPAYP
jgi:hypothetical protein